VDSRIPSWSEKGRKIKTVMTNIDAGAGCSGGGIVSFDHKNKTFRLEAVISFIRAPGLDLQFPIGSKITIQKNKKKTCISSEKYPDQAVSRTQICSGNIPKTKLVSENKDTLIKEVTGMKKSGKRSPCWSGSAGYSTQNYINALYRIRQRAEALHRTHSSIPANAKSID
jgi:hypothetical protein